MKDRLRPATEEIARKTTRRGFFGRGLDLAFGALAGAAAGGLTRSNLASARHTPTHTTCAFPGPPCPCSGCNSTGVCAKPCVINTTWYGSGCWVSTRTDDGRSITCCDCTCGGLEGINVCGCGSDHHNEISHCPDGTADTGAGG